MRTYIHVQDVEEKNKVEQYRDSINRTDNEARVVDQHGTHHPNFDYELDERVFWD